MKLYIARHGQSTYNALELCNDDPKVEVGLTELGLKQAEDLALKLKDVDFELITASEMERAHRTAEIVNRYHGVEIAIDARLNDIRTGFDGRSVAEYWAAREAAADPYDDRFNGGESLRDVAARTGQVLDDLKRRNLGCVLVITSMSVVQAFRGIIEGLDDDQTWGFPVDNADFLVYDL